MSFYFIYKISQTPSNIVKALEKIDSFGSYKEAKSRVKELRNHRSTEEASVYKIIFAESELEAEERLQENREAPIVQEWEK